MIKTGLSRATKQFFVTTTLHGFKYLCSGFHSDRVCWLAWCVASACCAGTLCAVLWARFLQVPALLAVSSALTAPQPLPTVAVCLPAASVAYLLVGHLSTDDQVIRRLILTFTHILQGKETRKDNLLLLDQLLSTNNVTVLDALYKNMPPCHEFAKKCRWQNIMMPCEKLFHRQLTQFGVCCVMQPNKIKTPLPKRNALFDSSKHLALVLQCSNDSLFFGCQLFTKYEGEETVNLVTLLPGSEYRALLTFTSVQDSDTEKLVAGTCVSSESYSRTMCMDTCMERLCGCSNPLRTIFEEEANVPPPCQLSQFNCLYKTDNASCNCMPSCKKISTELSLENNKMTSVYSALDPMYEGLNASTATVIQLRVLLGGSRIFTRQPTETWFTLLSSLGGVFNMFLGVGLFSALEFLFFLLVRVPAAMKTFPEMDVPVTHVQSRY